jgi:hypothetical protein
MKVKCSVGIGNGDEDRDLLIQYRSGAQAAAYDDDLTQRPAGWPAPLEGPDDDAEARAVWAW